MRLQLDIRKLLTMRMREYWHRLLGEVLESPSLETLKNCLDVVMGNLF